MKQLLTTGIVLSRTDFGEADRIVTLLTPEDGKVRLMARGVRRIKSRMAGGIELFSVSDITYIKGRGELGTLVSSRLIKHYSKIVQNIDRVQLGYECIKVINKVTEDQPESDYFDLLEAAFEALDDSSVSVELVNLWFQAQLLKLAGYTPNLLTDIVGNELVAEQKYEFDSDAVAFKISDSGRYGADHIKTLRLLFSANKPETIGKVEGVKSLLGTLKSLMDSLSDTNFN